MAITADGGTRNAQHRLNLRVVQANVFHNEIGRVAHGQRAVWLAQLGKLKRLGEGEIVHEGLLIVGAEVSRGAIHNPFVNSLAISQLCRQW